MNVKLHSFPCGRVHETCFCLILIQDMAACLVHKIPVPQLLIRICHEAVFPCFIINRRGRLCQVVPCPGIIRIGKAGIIKHFPVIYKAHRILVLWHPVDASVRPLCIVQGYF